MAAASTMCRNTWLRLLKLPDHLIWFKWEAYLTWVTGFLLLIVQYYLNASSYLIDPSCAGSLRRGRPVGISVGRPGCGLDHL